MSGHWGCRLEQSQVVNPQTLMRLAALLSIIAVRMLQVRDLAQQACGDAASGVEALTRSVPRVWIQVVATVRGLDAATMTPREFWLGIAREGGWMGRKGDGRPGWKVIWRGGYDLSHMVRYAETLATNIPPPKRWG